jgi:hypothetical protein
MAHKVRRELKV